MKLVLVIGRAEVKITAVYSKRVQWIPIIFIQCIRL